MVLRAKTGNLKFWANHLITLLNSIKILPTNDTDPSHIVEINAHDNFLLGFGVEGLFVLALG